MVNKYNINKAVLDLVELYNKATDRTVKIQITKSIFDHLKNNYAFAINNKTRDIVKNTFPDDWSAESHQINEYKPVGQEVGKTFVAVVEKENQDAAYCFILIVRKTANNIEKFPGAASRYQDTFAKVFNTVFNLIEREKKSVVVRGDNMTSSFDFVIKTTTGEIVNDNISGRSLELPLAIALFSSLVNKDLMPDVFSTGALEENEEVLLVDNAKTKVEAAITEFSGINKLIIPNVAVFNNGHTNKDILVHKVQKLEDAIAICYPDYKEIILGTTITGLFYQEYIPAKVTYNSTVTDATRILINFDTNAEITPSILAKYENSNFRFAENHVNGKLVILDNSRINWLTSYYTTKLANIVGALAIYDPKFSVTGKMAVVVLAHGNSKYKIGELITWE
ncbi:MAG: hypothetical protein IAE91_01640 [Ignavibacteriaceae bacterium]|nr:hypothetical protein [Ignavibacteriaceae bacterium]